MDGPLGVRGACTISSLNSGQVSSCCLGGGGDRLSAQIVFAV